MNYGIILNQYIKLSVILFSINKMILVFILVFILLFITKRKNQIVVLKYIDFCDSSTERVFNLDGSSGVDIYVSGINATSISYTATSIQNSEYGTSIVNGYVKLKTTAINNDIDVSTYNSISDRNYIQFTRLENSIPWTNYTMFHIDLLNPSKQQFTFSVSPGC